MSQPMTNPTVTVPRVLLADLLSLDREKRIPAERHLYAILAQPAAELDELAAAVMVEVVEVVGFLMRPDLYEPYISLRRDRCDGVTEPLMTVAQHERIVAALASAQPTDKEQTP